MITVALPMAGTSAFFPESENKFPKIFTEINGQPMIQLVLANLQSIKRPIRFLFIINEADAKKFRLDNVLRMLTRENCDIILQKGQTKGAVCSLLLGIKHINHDQPLLISNADQLLDCDCDSVLQNFDRQQADGGVVTFDSIHPQWSFARVSEELQLLETTEKEPISRHAIAGFYYFQRGRDFVENAMRAIAKDRSYNGLFYTSLVFNEMILQNKNLLVHPIKSEEYHSFYSPAKIREYESEMRTKAQ